MEDHSNKLLKILNPIEYKEYYSIPEFLNKERREFFSVNILDFGYKPGNKNLETKVFFILQFGYFKARYRFFNFRFDMVLTDVEYILKRYFNSISYKELNNRCHKETIQLQRKMILDFFSFRQVSEKIFSDKAKHIITIDANPRYIFRELVRFSEKHNYILPFYTNMQRIISKAIIDEENKIFNILENQITSDVKNKIEALLIKENDTRYVLTLIKSPATGFSFSDIQTEINKQEILEPLFYVAKSLFSQLAISNLSIRYFARLIESYTIFQLSRFIQIKQMFYVLCFVYYRYLTINDNLIKTFLYLVGKYHGDVKQEVDISVLNLRTSKNKNISKIGLIMKIITNKNFKCIFYEDFLNKAFSILDIEEIDRTVDNYLIKSGIDYDNLQWEQYDKKFPTIRKNIRHIFERLNFSCNSEMLLNNNLFDAILFFQKNLRDKNMNFTHAPVNFIPKRDKKYLFTNNKDKHKAGILINSRYEIFLYKSLKNKIVANDIIIKDSMEYRSLEDDLIDKEYFENNRVEILKSLELPYIENDFKGVVDEKMDVLENNIHNVNKNILENKNVHFNLKPNNSWNLKYEGVERDDINNPIFQQIPQIELVDLYRFVKQKTNFDEAFTHIINRFAKKEFEPDILDAAIIGYANNMGLGRMSHSSGISFSKLKTVATYFLREETLKFANEKIINDAKKLPIFKYYNISDIGIHSNIDGQKQTVAFDTINARYSPKYFGLEKGISILTMNANFQALSSKIISSNEYEGHHLLELYLMNDSEIQPTIQSADSHGVSDINFALCDFFGLTLATRPKRLNHRYQFLFSPNNVNSYDDSYILKPLKKIDKKIILAEEKNIQRIIASLALKSSTVSTIVKKIYSCPKSNKTRKALSEYNKIINSNYILTYIDSLSLRQDVQIAINRGESFNKLRKAVRFANGGKIIARSESEQSIYQECSRLLCNIIIYYNSYILSHFLLKKQISDDNNQIEALKRISPIAWAHINLYGKYIFDRKFNHISDTKLEDILNNINLVDPILEEDL